MDRKHEVLRVMRFAWCFSDGRLHRFPREGTPRCDGMWIPRVIYEPVLGKHGFRSRTTDGAWRYGSVKS